MVYLIAAGGDTYHCHLVYVIYGQVHEMWPLIRLLIERPHIDILWAPCDWSAENIRLKLPQLPEWLIWWQLLVMHLLLTKLDCLNTYCLLFNLHSTASSIMMNYDSLAQSCVRTFVWHVYMVNIRQHIALTETIVLCQWYVSPENCNMFSMTEKCCCWKMYLCKSYMQNLLGL